MLTGHIVCCGNREAIRPILHMSSPCDLCPRGRGVFNRQMSSSMVFLIIEMALDICPASQGPEALKPSIHFYFVVRVDR